MVEEKLHPTPGKVKMKKPIDFRPPDVKEVGLKFVARQESEDGKLLVHYLHYDQLYFVQAAELTPYAKGLLEGKLMGTRCPICGDKFFPPRVNCWNLDCELEKCEWVEIKPYGRVHTFTTAGWSGRSSLKNLPFVLAYCVLDDCKTAIANYLKNIEPWDAQFNMPIKVEFVPKEKRVGAITDFYFVPTDDWKPGPMTPEKERIKKLCQPIFEWVKTLK